MCDGNSSNKGENISKKEKKNNEFAEKENKIVEVVHYQIGDNEGRGEEKR